LRLREDGWDVTIVPVDSAARVDADVVLRALRDDTALVSIIAYSPVRRFTPVTG
jgi:cysteine desulfurase